jgi:hypothetical protein
MKFEILKKSGQIVLISRENIDSKALKNCNYLGAIISTPDKWSFPEKNLLDCFEKKYDVYIIERMISAYALKNSINSLRYNVQTIKKYELFFSDNYFIDENKEITPKGIILDFVFKNKLSGKALEIEIEL